MKNKMSYLYLCKILLLHLNNKLIYEIHIFATIY